jgi:uncharacterized phage protein (TIGR02220 family)
MQLRSRVTKPGFFANEDLALIEPIPWPRDLFHGLWSLADREGRLEDRPMRIQIHIFPYYHKQASAEMISEWLSALQKNDLLTRYEVNGTKYIQIHNFKKHQPIHHKESKSEIPEVPESYMLPQASSKHGHTQAKQGGACPKHIGNSKSKERGKSKSKERGKSKEHIPYQEIIDDLNLVLKANYRVTTEAYREKIRGRWKDGYRLEDFKYVHRIMFDAWSGTDDEQWLTPDTLYRSSKFPKYRERKPPTNHQISDVTRHNLAVAKRFVERGEKKND